MTSDVKRVHEAEVFRAFIEACRLPIDHESVENVEPDYPDIRCLGADGKARLFELGEILWEDESANVKTLPHGEALSAEAFRPTLLHGLRRTPVGGTKCGKGVKMGETRSAGA